MTPSYTDLLLFTFVLGVMWVIVRLAGNILLTRTTEIMKNRLVEDLTYSNSGAEYDFWGLRHKYLALRLSEYASCVEGLERQGLVEKLFRIDLETIIVDFGSVEELPETYDLETFSVVVRRV